MERLLSKGDHERQRPPEGVVAPHDTLTRDTDGQVQPHYLFVPQPARRLAHGELVAEPALGLARVVTALALKGENAGSTFVRITWADDYGPTRATARYSANQPLPVRVADYDDRLLVRQAIDQAEHRNRDISGAIARLIAAHLHLGPRSALYGFAVNGAVPDRLYDELNQIDTSRPVYRSWVSALARYCLTREDLGQVAGWGPNNSATSDAEPVRQVRQHNPARAATRPLLPRRTSIETVRQLMDAAFALGVAAGQSEVSLARARGLMRQHTLG